MKHFEFELKAGRRTRLWGQGWEPDGPSRGVIGLVHGLGEHSERYRPVADAFNRAGYAVAAFDLCGHGRSSGRRGHAPNYGVLMSDISAFLNEISGRYPNLPRILYGHSLGGNLAIHYVLKHKSSLAGVIASAPMFRTARKPPAWKIALLRSLCAIRLNVPVSTGLEQSALCRDFHMVRLYENDPLVHDRISPSLAVNMLRAGEWNLKHAPEFPLPILLMHGEADRITSVEASIEFAAHQEHRCTLKIWNGLYHELHNEPEKQEVFDYAIQWMNRLCSATP